MLFVCLWTRHVVKNEETNTFACAFPILYYSAPLEYTFTPIGSDWPSMDDATQQGAAPVAVGMWRSAKNAFRSGPSMIYRYLTTTRTIQDRTMGL